MYLKSIEIHGFKSFAEKTLFTFMAPQNGVNSLTAIVGPNGSGKSNVSDAMRWVMGEQSMKQLRGKKASDIIFSGSASKGQMSVASVMMTLDNRDGRADVDYEELVIGRRIYHSGESEYVVNENVVRLIDLQILLAKAQFGQGSYAVIGQGMIDRLLLQSTAERKDFFDEASGIKEFQIKRHQTILRLTRSKEHIAQAEMLLQEISPRLKTLSRQVKKLEQRQELELELRELQEQYYTTLYTHHQEQIITLHAEMDGLLLQLQTAQKKLTTIQEELASLAHASSRHDIFAALEEQYQRLVQQKNAQERERAILQGKLQTEYTKSGNYQMGWVESKIEELTLQQQQYEQQINELETVCSRAGQETQALKHEHQQLQLNRTALKGEISTLESRLLQLKSEQSAFQISGFQAVQAVLEARQHLPRVQGVVAQLGEVEKRYHIALDTAAGGQLASVVVEDEESAKACVEYLRQGKYGVATFLPMNKIRPREVPPYVYELLNRDGVHGLAVNLVRFDEKYRAIFEFVFGSTVIVENFSIAKNIGIGRVRMVTLEGDVFETSGAVKGGYRTSRQHGISFAGSSGDTTMQERADDCEQVMVQKQGALIDMERTEETLRSQISEKETVFNSMHHKFEMLIEQKQHIDTELARLEQEMALSTMSKEQFGDAMRDIAQQKEAIDAHIVALEKEILQAQANIAAFNDEEEQKKHRVFALQDAMQQEQITVNALIEQKNAKQIVLAKLDTKQEDLSQEVYQELHTSLQVIIDRGIAPLAITELDDVQASVQKLKYQLSLIGGIDEEVVKEYEETKTRHEGLTAQLDDLTKAITDLETLLVELDTVMKKKRNKAFKQIKKEFSRYFEQLFSGGSADLVEVYGLEDEGDEASEQADDTARSEVSSSGDDISVDSVEPTTQAKKGKNILKGIDIVACPPGKKIKHIQALSGGERTMTSIALMCAILKTNPSPFVILDEVEAALDEANTLRVVDILKELAHDSQFVIITHNKVTMHAADALYGVTMGNDGISHVLSIKLEDAPLVVAE